MSSQHYGSRDCGCGGANAITALGPTKSARSGHHARTRATGQAASSGGGCGCGGSSGGDCGCGSPGTSCECNPGVLVRPTFFAGQLLTDDDLQALMNYDVTRQRLHNRFLVGSGVACGLAVTCHPCGGGRVIVQPGYAVDCCGNEILVPCAVELDINAMVRALTISMQGQDCGDPCAEPVKDRSRQSRAPLAAAGPDAQLRRGARQATPNVPGDDKAVERGRRYCLYLNYCEEPTDLVAPYSQDDSCAVTCQPSRLREGFTFRAAVPQRGSGAAVLHRPVAVLHRRSRRGRPQIGGHRAVPGLRPAQPPRSDGLQRRGAAAIRRRGRGADHRSERDLHLGRGGLQEDPRRGSSNRRRGPPRRADAAHGARRGARGRRRDRALSSAVARGGQDGTRQAPGTRRCADSQSGGAGACRADARRACRQEPGVAVRAHHGPLGGGRESEVSPTRSSRRRSAGPPRPMSTPTTAWPRLRPTSRRTRRWPTSRPGCCARSTSVHPPASAAWRPRSPPSRFRRARPSARRAIGRLRSWCAPSFATCSTAFVRRCCRRARPARTRR